MRWYWLRFRDGLPITVHLAAEPWRFRWSRIYGVQVGSWFLGAIQGRRDAAPAGIRKTGLPPLQVGDWVKLANGQVREVSDRPEDWLLRFEPHTYNIREIRPSVIKQEPPS